MKKTKYSQIINLQKPAQYMDNEINAFHKDFEKNKIKFLMCFPDLYEIGMSNNGIIYLYNILNKTEDIVCDRLFMPDYDYFQLLKQNKEEIKSLEHKKQLKEFSIIGFSWQYELSITNIVHILKCGNISVKRKDRKEEEPIIIFGGPCTVNPNTIKTIADIIVIGDGEEIIFEIIDTIKKYEFQTDKKNILKIISELKFEDGNSKVLVPSYNEKNNIGRNIVYDYQKYLKNYKPLIPLIDLIHNRINIEIMRGCTRGCRFCLAGFLNRPIRYAEPDKVINTLLKIIEDTGLETTTFTSLSSSDYPCLEELLLNVVPILNKKKNSLSVPSLRIDSAYKFMKHKIYETKKTSITLAPEAGTEILRKRINKNLSDDDIIKSLGNVVDCGISSIKLYFMIGFPGEEMSNVEGIVNLINKIIMKYSSKINKLKVAISVFVPKPHTPLQWSAFSSKTDYDKKIKYLCDNLRNRKVSINWHNYETSFVETLITRGDEKISEVIFDAVENGAILDDWSEHFNFDYWNDAIKKNNIILKDYISELDVNKKTFWDNIDLGINKKYLQDEYNKYFEITETKNCQVANCNKCSTKFKCDFKIKKYEFNYLNEELKSSQNFEVKKYYLITFAKTEKSRFISHLNLQKVFLRGLIKINLPLVYSKGFNKRPIIEFAAPLSLGITGDKELLMITVAESINIENTKNELNDYFNGVIEIKNIFDYQKNNKISLMSKVKKSVFEIYFYEIQKNNIVEQIKNFVLEKRTKKGKLKKIKISDFLETISLEKNKLILELLHKEQATINLIKLFNQMELFDSISEINRIDLQIL